MSSSSEGQGGGIWKGRGDEGGVWHEGVPGARKGVNKISGLDPVSQEREGGKKEKKLQLAEEETGTAQAKKEIEKVTSIMQVRREQANAMLDNCEKFFGRPWAASRG